MICAQSCTRNANIVESMFPFVIDCKVAKLKFLPKEGVLIFILKNKTNTVTYFFYILVEFSIKFPAMYVNIKKIL